MISPELLNLLDDVTATLETVLLRHGHTMSQADQFQLTLLVERARATVDAILRPRFDGWCSECAGNRVPGVMCGIAADGERDRKIVRRCETCKRYASDDAAADAFAFYMWQREPLPPRDRPEH
jgi:hypothetical protein